MYTKDKIISCNNCDNQTICKWTENFKEAYEKSFEFDNKDDRASSPINIEVKCIKFRNMTNTFRPREFEK